MNALILSMTLAAQPPVVPDGPPTVPDAPPVAPVIIEPVTAVAVDPVEVQRTFAAAVRSRGWLVWVDDVPYTSIPAEHIGAVTISGPWHNGRHVTHARLQSPTRKQIEAALAQAKAEWNAERTASLTATPKRFPLPSAGEVADGDMEATGPWPDDFPFIEGMQRYRRATRTQEIAVTNGSDRITPVSRIDLHQRDNRWLVSGGMLGVDAFRSDLYANEAARGSREYVGNISVLNSLGSYQQNRGWRREFANGSKFLDVLSTGGKVFEIRQREKAAGKWSSEVVYENEQARPEGYAGLNKSCVSCHNATDGPGTGPYAGPLVLGSDTVFSMPFRALEPQAERQSVSPAPERQQRTTGVIVPNGDAQETARRWLRRD